MTVPKDTQSLHEIVDVWLLHSDLHSLALSDGITTIRRNSVNSWLSSLRDLTAVMMDISLTCCFKPFDPSPAGKSWGFYDIAAEQEKEKVTLQQVTKAQWGSRGTALPFL